MFSARPAFTFNEQGDLISTDWSAYDAVAAPRLDGSYYDDKVQPRSFTPDIVGWMCPGSPYWLRGELHDKKVRQVARETARHFKEKGWFDRAYVYCLDEPAASLYPAIAADIRLVKEGAPDWAGKFMCTAPAEEGKALVDSIDIFCVSTHFYGDWSDYGQRAGNHYGREEFKSRVVDKGGKFWLYVANYPTSEPFMSYQLDRKNSHEPRFLKWAAWYENASGFLFWCTMGSNAAVPNPYQNPWYSERYSRDGKGSGTNGDAFLMYPGDRDGRSWKAASGHGVPFAPIDGPLPSIRLKDIRNGLEDWEMFKLGESAGLGEQIRKEIATIYTRLGCTEAEYVAGQLPWDRDGVKFMAVRDNIARLIESATPPIHANPKPLAPDRNNTQP